MNYNNNKEKLIFEKVSLNQFISDFRNIDEPFFKEILSDENYSFLFEEIKMPSRATSGSVGYDFFSPIDVYIPAHQSFIMPTGIRFNSENPHIGLFVYPKSGLGFKYFCQLANTVGIIDSDYYGAKNQGHILIKLIANGDKDIEIKRGQSFVQGVLTYCFYTSDDKLEGQEIIKRNGGFGSTSE